MEALHSGGEMTVNRLREWLPEAPTPMALRTLLKILLRKGLVRRRKRGREFLYAASADRKREGVEALRKVLRIYFDGSLEEGLAAWVSAGGGAGEDAELVVGSGLSSPVGGTGSSGDRESPAAGEDEELEVHLR